MRFSAPRLFVSSVVLLASVGCVSYPVVKPEAFNPKPKVAVIAFHAEPVTGALGFPSKITGIDSAHEAFKASLAKAGYDLVDVETIRGCSQYFRLQKPTIDMGTSAKGLERVFVTSETAPGLAKCVGADVVVTVYGTPELKAGTQIMGVGTSKILMNAEIHAFNDGGQEIWLDRLGAESATFKVAGSVMDPKDVENAALTSLTSVSNEAVLRFNEKVAAAPTP